jgi:hypothetical protein
MDKKYMQYVEGFEHDRFLEYIQENKINASELSRRLGYMPDFIKSMCTRKAPVRVPIYKMLMFELGLEYGYFIREPRPVQDLIEEARNRICEATHGHDEICDDYLEVKVMIITPEVAKEMLEHNTHNRPISNSRVSEYMRDMESDRWVVNGEAITFAKSGWLANGQHRLMAIAKSGKAYKCAVHVVSDEAAKYFDIGRKRLFKDSAVLNMPQLRDVDVRIQTAAKVLKTEFIESSKHLTEAESECFLIENANEIIQFNSLIKVKSKCAASPILAALLVAYHAGYNPEKLVRFYKALSTGIVSSVEENTVLHFRNYLQSHVKEVGVSGRKDKYLKAQRALYCFEKGLKSNPINGAGKVYYEWK